MRDAEQLKAAVIDWEGRRMLFWLELSGDEIAIHSVTSLEGVGQIDMKVTVPVRDEDPDQEKLWARISADGFSSIARGLMREVENLERRVGGEG